MISTTDHTADTDDHADGASESTGRHRFVPPDERPTETLPRVQEQTPVDDAFTPSSGTLPGLPVVDAADEPLVELVAESDGIPADPDPEATVRLIAAIRATPSPEELADAAEVTTAGWKALEADLDGPRFRPLPWYVPVVTAVVVTVVVTWFVAWLVMG